MMPLKIDKTETSVFTLLSLYILIDQSLQSLFGNEDILKSDFEMDTSTFKDLVNDTIHEALVYQILLRACAYMDEWNGTFGVRTEMKDKETIDFIKKATKSAHKSISSWKEMKDFRNQAIAHNHRDKKGANIYLEPRQFHSPESNGEILLLAFCLKKMTDTVHHFFPQVATKILNNKDRIQQRSPRKCMTEREIESRMPQIEEPIAKALVNAIQ